MLNGIIVWHSRRLLRIVGWLGVSGIGLALAAVLFHFWMLAPLRTNVADMYDEVKHLRERIPLRAADSRHKPTDQLAEFYRFFPEDAVMMDTLGRVYAAAAQENIVLEHGEYQLAPVLEGKLLRYNLNLPIKGPYTKLRRFIARVLQDNPSLALEGVSFSRQAAMEIGVAAQVRMTLFLISE